MEELYLIVFDSSEEDSNTIFETLKTIGNCHQLTSRSLLFSTTKEIEVNEIRGMLKADLNATSVFISAVVPPAT